MPETYEHILRDALRRLPEHDAPETVWPRLEADLDLTIAIDRHIPMLPEHLPPDGLWARLEAQIEEARPHLRKPVVVRMWPFWAAAAAICALVAAVWFLYPSGHADGADMSIRYSEEQVDTVLLAVAREPEDEAFQLLEDICLHPAPICSDPEFVALKAELDELTAAKSELRQAMGIYETSPELNEQLTRIERERSELLRRMVHLSNHI